MHCHRNLDLTAAQTRDVYFGYDILGRQLFARFDSAGSNSDGVTNTYNGFGDLLTSRLEMGSFDETLTSIYDGAGRRTRLTHPNNQAFTYAYDNLSRLSGVYQGTGTGTPLATFTYASNGLVSSRSEGTGASSATSGWDDIGRLTSQADAFSGGTNNVSWTFAYNPASQIVTETRSNDNYGLAKTNVNLSYSVNGLNQYTTAGGASLAYDANGNLTDDGPATYTYDVENRLVKAVAGATTTNLVYDPLGRLFEINQGTSQTTKRFLHDGDATVLELGSVNQVTDRYVHGSNAAADDPLVWYPGATLTTKRWLHADHLGSIVAVTNSSGGSPSINRYDEYGVPVGTNIGRFQYTGQAWVPELGLYYYKARFYSPGLGRFMQTDPVGYEDNVNLYAYAGNDPINAFDSSGQAVQYRRDGNHVYLHWNIAYFGAGNKRDVRERFSNAIVSYWNGRHGTYIVHASVKSYTFKQGTRPSQDFIDRNPHINFIEIPRYTYRAFVNPDNQTGKWGANRPGWTAAHEACHLAGCEEKYNSDGPYFGWENDIMGASEKPVTEKAVEEVIRANDPRRRTNSTRKEPSVGVSGCPYISAQPVSCGSGVDFWN